jgi:hypothetical protein
MATIQGVYVALFGRPADTTGLTFFKGVTNDGADLSAIGDLTTTKEYTDRFVGQTNAQIVNSIYQSLFGHDADAAGLNFFLGELLAGRQTIQTIAINILDGAQGTDKEIVDRKIAAADAFTAELDTAAEILGYSGPAAAASGVAFLKTVTTTAPTAAEVTAAAAAAVAIGTGATDQTFSLTTAVGESLIGSDGNDVFTALADAGGLGGTPPATFNVGDTVDGGAGTDTINIIAGSAGAPAPAGAVKNVEIVNLISDAPGDGFVLGTADVAGFAGVTQLWQKGGAASLDVTGLTNSVTAGFANTAVALNAGDVTAATGAANDTVNVALTSVATGAVVTVGEVTVGGVKTVNVNGSVAGAGAITVDMNTATVQGTGLAGETTLNLGLTSNGTVTVVSGTLKTQDMSASTGNLTMAGALGTIETIKGGSGNDVLLGGAASKLIEGGAGNDTITAGGVAGEVINGGANGTTLDAITLGANAVAQTVITDVGQSGITLAKADTITNFATLTDKLDFNLAAGSATNFLDGGASSSFTDGLTNANTAMDGTVQYYLTNDGTDSYLYVDADLDGTADMAVTLLGLGAAGGVVAGDIIA